MTIENKLKNLILERYGSMVEFSKRIEMPNATLSSIMTRGIHKANIDNIIKICKALDISADELARDRIVPNEKTVPVTDVAEMIGFLKMDISSHTDLTLDGKPLTEEDRQSIIDGLDLCVELTKRRMAR